MDARQLTYFLAIVDHGGFGRAAEQLYVAQPSLSQAIAGLERELGAKLFVRAGRRVALTEPGKQLVAPARRVLRDLEHAKDVVTSAGELRRGRVDVVTMPSPGVEPLTAIVTAFAQTWPAMTMNILGVLTPDTVVETVLSGVAEIGLLGAADKPYTADLAVRHLEDQPLVLISPPGTALPPRESVSRAELAGLRLIVSHRGSLMRQLVDDVLASGGEAHLAAEVDHRASILPLVMSGLGHAVMPSAWSSIALPMGAQVRRIEPPCALRIFSVWRQESLTPGATAFLDVLTAHAASDAGTSSTRP